MTWITLFAASPYDRDLHFKATPACLFKMVALMLVSVGLWLPGSDGALSCCFPRPDFHRLGPPPRPPGLTLNLPCNGTECCLATVSLPLGRTPYTKSLEPTTRPSPYPLPTEPIISSSTGIGGLKGGELAALGLGIVVVVLIILVLALYWKKRYKPRVNPTPMKEETNYLHNYRVRGWTWRPGPGPRAPHDDVERSDDKKALITSPVTSHMSLSSGSVDAGYVGGDNGAPPCGDGADQDLVQAKYIMKGESSTSSGIGLSQGDIQEELPPSEDLVTYHPSGSVQILNGRIGGYTDRFGRTPRPKLGKQMYRSQSNNLLRDKLPQSNGHYGYHVRKSASNPNQLDCYPNSSNRPSMPAPTDNRGCEDSMNLQNGHAYRAPIETNGAKSMVFPILEPIRSSHGSDHHSSSASVEYTNGSSGDPHHHSHNPHHYHHHQQQTHHHHTPTPPPPPPPAPLQNINTSHSSRQVHNSRENGDATLPNNRLDPLQDTGSPDTKSHHRKRRKKRRSSSKQELDCADHVALDTISKHRSHTLPPLAGTYSHQTAGTIDKNGEYVA